MGWCTIVSGVVRTQYLVYYAGCRCIRHASGRGDGPRAVGISKIHLGRRVRIVYLRNGKMGENFPLHMHNSSVTIGRCNLQLLITYMTKQRKLFLHSHSEMVIRGKISEAL